MLDELSRIHAAVHDLTRNPELGYTGTPTKTDPHDDRPINNLTDLQLELENRLSNPEDWSRSMDKLYAELTSEKTLSKEALTRKLLSLCPLTPNQARSVTQMLSGGSSNGNTPEQHGRQNSKHSTSSRNKTLFLSPDTTTASSSSSLVWAFFSSSSAASFLAYNIFSSSASSIFFPPLSLPPNRRDP